MLYEVITDPGHVHGAAGVAHEQKLHGGADVDENRPRVVLEYFQGLLRGEIFQWVLVSHGRVPLEDAGRLLPALVVFMRG